MTEDQPFRNQDDDGLRAVRPEPRMAGRISRDRDQSMQQMAARAG